MGAVYLARDPELDRAVAIKLVKDDLTDEPELGERFAREARSAARLRHPNIITVFDIGEHEGRPFIAMEYIPGESLSEIIRREPKIDPGWVLRWMESLCEGLAHAHKAGIVHRDIKPANVMIDQEGVLKIVDFGIARAGESQLTRSGVLVGTTNYMAPEQLLGVSTDHRADIFAVGAVFYELLCGKKAFPGTIADGLFNRICNEPPEPLVTLCPGIDPAIPRVVDGALEKDPSRRYQDLAAMAADVARVRAGQPVPGPLSPETGEATPTMIQTGVPTMPVLQPSSATFAPSPSSSFTPATTPKSATASGSRTGTQAPDESASQRRRRAEIFVDAADTALRAREFAQAREMLDKAARFDPDAEGLSETRASLEREEATAREADRRHAEAEAALSDASSCLARGDFAAARELLRQAKSAEPENYRAQSMAGRVQEAESAARQRESQAAFAAKKRRSGSRWLTVVIVVSVIISLAAVIYLATR